MGKFTVDTHLFRELGELLVGRDSTALVELIKNSYDADATRAIVYAEALTDPKRGYIEVSDDGVGMTPSVFEEGFLRVASRLKASGVRTSRLYQRRMTGEKGIGRLAAHKLAHVLEVTSIPRQPVGEPGVSAKIDWDEIEKAATFDDLGDVPIEELETAERSHGTTVRLTKLRRAWTAADLGRFLAEVQTFEPPRLLTMDLVAAQDVSGPLAVGQPVIRDQDRDDPGFTVQLEGELARGDDYWEALWGEIDWIVEIDAQRSGVSYSITPTSTYVAETPNAEPATFRIDHPSELEGPFFHARILIREGRINDPSRGRWARRIAGVRVYYEGFRILPYGEPGNDWVGIERRYMERTRELPWLSDIDLELGDEPKDAGLSTPQASTVVGAVFLLEKNAPSLRMLVNREGFVPEAGYYTLQKLVRVAMDLSTRVRAAASEPRRETRSTQRRQVRENPEEAIESPEPIRESFRRLEHLADEAQRRLEGGDVGAASEAMKQAKEEAERIAEVTGELISERAMLRVLASIGMQMAAFVHETNTTLRLASELEDDVNAVKGAADVPRATQRRLSRVAKAVSDLRRNIERQAAFLVDVVTPDARRRRSAQKLRDRFETATALVLARARRQDISIENRIPAGIKTPPMFPAEVATIFMNLLTNAIKAAGEGGNIVADATVDDGAVIVTVANTGEEIDLATAERWFRPFESTTVELDPVLGQGLGLGLPVTRAMIEEYGGTIGFVDPPSDYASAVQFRLPGARTR